MWYRKAQIEQPNQEIKPTVAPATPVKLVAPSQQQPSPSPTAPAA